MFQTVFTWPGPSVDCYINCVVCCTASECDPQCPGIRTGQIRVQWCPERPIGVSTAASQLGWCSPLLPHHPRSVVSCDNYPLSPGLGTTSTSTSPQCSCSLQSSVISFFLSSLPCCSSMSRSAMPPPPLVSSTVRRSPLPHSPSFNSHLYHPLEVDYHRRLRCRCRWWSRCPLLLLRLPPSADTRRPRVSASPHYTDTAPIHCCAAVMRCSL